MGLFILDNEKGRSTYLKNDDCKLMIGGSDRCYFFKRSSKRICPASNNDVKLVQILTVALNCRIVLRE